MTQITISLNQGDNYISFPATSTDNFETIFTNAGIINNIPENGFLRFNPITQISEPVEYSKYIEKGMGYDLYMNEPAQLTYDGTEYTMIFDEFRSNLFPGWNLVGTGSNNIISSSWCKITDPETLLPTTILEPKKSYYIYYDNCLPPSTMAIGSILGFTVSSLFLIYMLKEFKVL